MYVNMEKGQQQSIRHSWMAIGKHFKSKMPFRLNEEKKSKHLEKGK
jgi:hypothetical protein